MGSPKYLTHSEAPQLVSKLGSPPRLGPRPLAKLELHIGDIVWLLLRPDSRKLNKLCTVNLTMNWGALNHPAVIINLALGHPGFVRICTVTGLGS